TAEPGASLADAGDEEIPGAEPLRADQPAVVEQRGVCDSPAAPCPLSELRRAALEERADALGVVGGGEGGVAQRRLRVVVGRGAVEDTGDRLLDRALSDVGAAGQNR